VDLAMGDFDGDRSKDLALATLEPRPELLLILFGDGSGGFERRDFPASHWHTFRQPLYGVDLGDGFDSLFAMALDSGGFARFAFLGREPRLLEEVSGVWVTHPAAAFGDLDGDGAKDMLLSGREELEVFLSRPGRQPGEPAFEPASSVSPSERGAWDVAVADLDGNGGLDAVTLGRSIVVHMSALAVRYIRGDAVDDGKIDITDPIAVLEHLFRGTGGRGPRCRDAWDSNGDGWIDISDAVYLLLFLFMGGNAPPAPFPGCGSTPGTGLGCGAHAACR